MPIESAGNEYATARTIWALFLALFATAIVLASSLIILLLLATDTSRLTTSVFLSIVAIGGALGGLIHSLNSFVTYVGVGKLKNRWVPQYLILPVLGMALALAVTMLVKANFLPIHEPTSENVNQLAATPPAPVESNDAHPPTPKSSDGQTVALNALEQTNAGTGGTKPMARKALYSLADCYFYAAVSVLVGMFVDLTVKKMQDVMFAIFGLPEQKTDHFAEKRADSDKALSGALAGDAERIIAKCDEVWDANKSDSNKFVIAVAQGLGIQEIPSDATADGILTFLSSQKGQAAGWKELIRGIGEQAQAADEQAQAAANGGKFVIGGVGSTDLAASSGQVVVVVSGLLEPANTRFPKAYWGKLNGAGHRKHWLYFAFPAPHRDHVRYFARGLPPPGDELT